MWGQSPHTTSEALDVSDTHCGWGWTYIYANVCTGEILPQKSSTMTYTLICEDHIYNLFSVYSRMHTHTNTNACTHTGMHRKDRYLKSELERS